MTEFNPVTSDEILKHINSLDNKQSTLDPIPCKLFKECKLELVLVLEKLINNSFKFGHFPDHLKTAIITPIIKSIKLDSEIMNNYTLVSNLTLIAKIIEKCALM